MIDTSTAITIGGFIASLGVSWGVMKTKQDADEKKFTEIDKKFTEMEETVKFKVREVWDILDKFGDWTRGHEKDSSSTRLDIQKEINAIQVFVSKTIAEVDGKLAVISEQLTAINKKLDARHRE